MSLQELEAQLSAVGVLREPDRWAVAAYRVAVARSESARSSDDVAKVLQLLSRAGRILTQARAPVEHARILTAEANCHRRLGDTERALGLFERAYGLLAGRVSRTEQAAALVNVGLASVERGRARAAISHLTDAVDLIHGVADPEANRVRGAALLNRAQAHQAVPDADSLRWAVADYRAACAEFDAVAVQRGMALHGLGTAIMEQIARDDATALIDDAIASFGDCLRILTVESFPFQYAVAEHSLAIAYERRSCPHDAARALNCIDNALSVFDPRLHRPHWRLTMETLERLDAADQNAGGVTNRIGRIVALIAETDEVERCAILRDRLGPLAELPLERRDRDVSMLAVALARLQIEDYEMVLRSVIPVLMELPEAVLEAMCKALCRAHASLPSHAQCDGALDRVVHDLLHGPQRVRVRDILELYGWVRP